MADRTTVVIESLGKPATDGELRERVGRIRAALDDASVQFSASAAVSELNTLRAAIGTRTDLMAERCEVLSMIGTIASRSALMEFEDGMEPLAELTALQAKDPRLAERRLRDHYTYAELAAGHALIPGNGASHALAAEQYGKAAALADTLPSYSENQRAGIREKQAYELHEAKRYDEALALNRDVLVRGEKLFGPSDPKLKTVLTNLAQNLHALGRKDEIEPYLIRVQTIAEGEKDIETVQDMLFQRGVLAFERGRMDEARQHMQDRIARLQAANETERLERAEEDYDELERRIVSGK